MRLRIAKGAGICQRRWCTGGRIVDHLKAGITGRENNIFFVGYQAKAHTLSGYSAHADQKGLIEWVESMP